MKSNNNFMMISQTNKTYILDHNYPLNNCKNLFFGKLCEPTKRLKERNITDPCEIVIFLNDLDSNCTYDISLQLIKNNNKDLPLDILKSEEIESHNIKSNISILNLILIIIIITTCIIYFKRKL